MKLIKLDQLTYLNPDNLIKVEAMKSPGRTNTYQVEFSLSGGRIYTKYFPDYDLANQYLDQLAQQINQDHQDLTDLTNRVHQLEQAILFQPGGLEYQQAEQDFQQLAKEQTQ